MIGLVTGEGQEAAAAVQNESIAITPINTDFSAYTSKQKL